MKIKPLHRTSGLILFALLFLAMVSYGAGGERRVNLRGDWKFNLGDNKNFARPDFNDAEWETIFVPASWQEEGFRRYNGFAWYRRSFEIEFKDNEPLFLELGRIDDTDEVYVNGHLIGTTGGFPPDYFTAYNVHRTYAIPTEYLVKEKKNAIAVRVYDEGGEGGIMGRDVGIYSYTDYFENGFNLIGNWKFHLFDDKKWAEESWNDADWENVVVPATWESQGFREYDGFAWYRKRFTLPNNFKSSDMVALLGKIDDMDEVFINGALIGGTGNIERKWARDDDWQKPRTYFIPDGLLKPGKENVIAVRVYDMEGSGGIFEGPISIIARTEYKQFWKRYRYDYYDHSFSFWSFLDWD
jgi:Glycosyl hydrolases family 2, sugar binding domain